MPTLTAVDTSLFQLFDMTCSVTDADRINLDRDIDFAPRTLHLAWSRTSPQSSWVITRLTLIGPRAARPGVTHRRDIHGLASMPYVDAPGAIDPDVPDWVTDFATAHRPAD